MTYALAIHEFEGIWRVYCNICRKDLGTMSISTLKSALAFAVNKGGVMCPECRTECCHRCNVHQQRGLHSSGFCWFCREENDAGMVLVFEGRTSCLVNQNSREPREVK